jgi:UDPglucose 6-dehydrogenase
MSHASIAVIGQGFVGGSLTTVFSERGTTVYAYDKAMKLAPGGNRSFILRSRSENGEDKVFTPSNITEFVRAAESQQDFTNVYFVCVPTPMYPDGSADLTIVESILTELATVPGERIAVVKSTVPPGSTETWNKKYESQGLHVIFNPEFLTEVNAVNDMRNQNRIILGGPRPWINQVKQVFQSVFPKVPIIKTSSTTAEMVKYITNNFLTVKVAFANEMAQVCEALDSAGLDIDYDKVVEYSKYDLRLGDSHWAVPGPDGKRGYGGHCFPKDINAMMSLARTHGVTPTVLEAAWKKNLEVRAPEDRDWELQVGRAVSVKKESA